MQMSQTQKTRYRYNKKIRQELHTYHPVSENSTYSGIIKHGCIICVVDDSHIKTDRRNDFNTELRCDKAFFRSFSGANVKQSRHYIIPTLVYDKPNGIVIHVGTSDILNHDNHENIASSIINIRLDCKNNGINEVFISSILVKEESYSLMVVLLPPCAVSMTCSEIHVRKMDLVLFVMVL